MMPGLGGGISAADRPKIPRRPDVKGPRLDLKRRDPKQRGAPERRTGPQRPRPPLEKKVVKKKARKKKETPGIVGRLIELLKRGIKSAITIARTREFIVVALVFLAYVAGFVLWQQYLNIFVYILPGILASAVVYRVLSNMKGERDRLQEEKDRLKLLEDRSRVLLDNALDCVFTLDLQGNITSFNRKSERVTGYLKKDVLGQSFGMFFPKERIKDFFEKLQKAISAGTVPMYETEINTIYGRRNFEMNITAIRLRDKLIGVQGIGRDVTDKNRLTKELKIATSDLERWSKRTVKKEMTILEMKNQIKTIKRELETHSAGNN